MGWPSECDFVTCDFVACSVLHCSICLFGPLVNAKLEHIGISSHYLTLMLFLSTTKLSLIYVWYSWGHGW